MKRRLFTPYCCAITIVIKACCIKIVLVPKIVSKSVASMDRMYWSGKREGSRQNGETSLLKAS